MNTAIAVMAAGESRRFDGCKLLAEVQGKPLLQHAVELAQSVAPKSLLVITGAWHPELLIAQRESRLSPIALIHNPRWEEGLGSSIAFACEQLPPDTDRLMVLLADQIALQTDHLHQLLEAEPKDIVCAHYNDHQGVPAVFSRKLFPLLKTLHGEPGARRILRNAEHQVHEIELPDAAIDIDTRAQLARLTQAEQPLNCETENFD